jgi:hypothetical protein
VFVSSFVAELDPFGAMIESQRSAEPNKDEQQVDLLTPNLFEPNFEQNVLNGTIKWQWDGLFRKQVHSAKHCLVNAIVTTNS